MTNPPPTDRPPRRAMFTRRPERERRSAGMWGISVAVHVVVIGGLVQLILHTTPVGSWLKLATRDRSPVVERISFLQLPKAEPGTAANPGRRGGNGRPESRAPAPPPLIAPREVPSTLPPVRSAPAPVASAEEPGTGPLVGGGGPTKGIRPSYNDRRLWGAAEAPIAAAPKTSKERLDSVIVAEVRKYGDSVAANTYQPNKFEKGDWTVNGPGGKWGVDQRYIRLGKVSIPTAVLGLLPLNATGNPIAYERNKTLAAMHAEIQEHAQQAMTEDEFKKAVRRIRERKERERRDADKSSKPISMPEGR